jgi:hypothetical protein
VFEFIPLLLIFVETEPKITTSQKPKTNIKHAGQLGLELKTFSMLNFLAILRIFYGTEKI